MSLENAQEFVSRMRVDKEFRSAIQTIGDNETLKSYLREQGFEFEERDLMRAMAACMIGLEQMMQGAE